jgi:hypothetical protein
MVAAAAAGMYARLHTKPYSLWGLMIVNAG